MDYFVPTAVETPSLGDRFTVTPSPTILSGPGRCRVPGTSARSRASRRPWWMPSRTSASPT